MVKGVFVDIERCEGVAEKVCGVKVKHVKTTRFTTQREREDVARFLLYFMAICHDTRGIEWVVNGKNYRGSDYLYFSLKRLLESDPNLFNPEKPSKLTLKNFCSWLSPNGDPKHCKIKRPRERVQLLHDLCEKLLQNHDGRVTDLLNLSGGYMKRPDGRGLINLLSKFRAYSDPLAKKTIVLATLLRQEGLMEIRYPENLTMAVDYHVVRVALRSGIVRIRSPRLETKLKSRRFTSKGGVLEVRKACLEAYGLVSKRAGVNILDLDMVFWQIGRNCCHYEHEPLCGDRPCFLKGCTLLQSIKYSCLGKCLLDGVCLASQNPEYVKFFEPKTITFYY